MIRRLLLLALAISLLFALGCGNLLNQQEAKFRDLGQVVEDNLTTSNMFWDNIVSFEYTGTPGEYRCVTKDLPDGHEAGKFAFNVFVVLDERNNTLVKTGRTSFKIIGEQNGTKIFELNSSAGAAPRITLHGPWEGEEYVVD